MKRLFLLLSGMLVWASCSAPKMAYQFDTHRYQSVSKKENGPRAHFTPAIRPDEWVASAEPGLATAPAATAQTAAGTPDRATQKKLQANSRAPRLTKKIRVTEVAGGGNPQLKNDRTTDLDQDLKMAAVFGTLGIVGLLLSGLGEFFLFIGGLALLAGTFFFIRWLIRQ